MDFTKKTCTTCVSCVQNTDPKDFKEPIYMQFSCIQTYVPTDKGGLCINAAPCEKHEYRTLKQLKELIKENKTAVKEKNRRSSICLMNIGFLKMGIVHLETLKTKK